MDANREYFRKMYGIDIDDIDQINDLATKETVPTEAQIESAIADHQKEEYVIGNGLSKLDEFRERLSKWLLIPEEDKDQIDFCLAVYLTQGMVGDPVWGIVIGPPGGGKSEILRALSARKDVKYLSTLTENSLISGYRERPRKGVKNSNAGHDPSLLPKLNGKVLVLKDLSTLMSIRSETRAEIIGILREAYDGFVNAHKGNIGAVEYHVSFTMLAAATPALDRADSIENELGERFIKFRLHSKDSAAKVAKASSSISKNKNMRTEIEHEVNVFLDSLPQIKPEDFFMTPDLKERLDSLAIFTATARSAVPRDRNGDRIQDVQPEVATRLVQQFGKLLYALARLRGRSFVIDYDFQTLQRVAFDCIPPNRLAVLRAIQNAPETIIVVENGRKQARPVGAKYVENIINLPHSTTWRAIDDLKALKIIEKDAPFVLSKLLPAL